MNEVLKSGMDASVNHVLPAADGGFLEARYVRRSEGYFICYLSVHTGCRMACRFCHLTGTGQTMMTPAGVGELLEQAARVFSVYDQRVSSGEEMKASKVHFNFMARGEPLDSPVFLNAVQRNQLTQGLLGMAKARGLEGRLNVSTIMPATLTAKLEDIFENPALRLYYSLYSMNPAFRRRWLPRAMDADQALAAIGAMQARLGRQVTLHHALIQDGNDSLADVRDILAAIQRHGVSAKFNLVRYNPLEDRHGCEPPEEHIMRYYREMCQGMAYGGRVVPRVGQDVFASCGMFVQGTAKAA